MATAITIDPAGALERLGAELPNLLAARARTAEAVAARRAALADLPLDPRASVVLFGSWGRRELTRRSDDDWALLVDGPARDGRRARAGGARRRARRRQPRAGPQRRLRRAHLRRRPALADRPRRRLQHQPHAPHAADARVPARRRRRRAPALLGAGARRLPRGRRPPLPAAAVLPQRPDPLLAHDLRGLRRQGARGRREVGHPQRQAAHLAQGPVRGRAGAAAADPPLRAARSAGRTSPRSSRRRRPTGSPPPSWTAACATRASARSAPTTAGSACSTTPARRGELESLTKETAHESAVFRDVRRHATELHRGLLVLLFDTELLPHVREHGIF